MTLSAKLTDGGVTAVPAATTNSSPLTRLFESISEKLSLFVLLVGLSNIVGWIFDIQFLKSILPGASNMKVNAALGLILLSVSLWMVQSKKAFSPAFRFASRLCASVAILIGSITLVEYIAGWNTGFDQLFIKESSGAPFTTHPGQPSPLMALNLVLAGFAIIGIDARAWRGIQLGHAALFVAGLTSLLTLLGHLYNVPHFLNFLPGSSAIAFNATMGMLALVFAILFARPAHGVITILINDTAGGVLARRTLFPTVIFMIALDFVLHAGEKTGLYDPDSETAIHDTLLIMFFTGIIIAIAKLLEKADLLRKLAEIETENRKEIERNRFFQLLPDLVCIAGRDGYFKKINQAVTQTLGYRETELLEKPFMEFIHPDDRPATAAEIEWQLKGGTTVKFENRYLCRDGSYKWLSWNAIAPDGGEGDAPLYAIARDMTEQKRRHEALFFENHELHEIVESNTDIFYIHNQEGKIIKWNKALANLTGLSHGELMLKPTLEFVCEGDRPFVSQKMREVFEKGYSTFEARFIGADGTLVPHLCNGYLLKDANGNITGFAGTGRDITERKMAEEKLKAAKDKAEAATMMKDKFITLLSHDLRAPLSSVILLQKVTMSNHGDAQCAECKTMLGKSVKVCETMMEMADDLLDSARLQTGAIRLNRKICHVRGICDAVLNDLNDLAVKKGIMLKNDLSDGARLYVDRILFQRVIHNLVVNALKFSAKGGVVSIFMPEGNSKQLAVKDTGTGISGKLLPDLFKHEVKTTTVGTSGERGTGFGLPMSMDIVKAHGGTIQVTSAKGEGATFFVGVPDIKPGVLVVDDDEVSRFVLGKYLENLGAEMLIAANGAEALEIVQKNEPILIITDIKMPVMDGFALLQKLKAESKYSHIPVLMITGSHTDDIAMRQKAFECKADDFIIKPLSEPDFMPRINRFISA